MSPKVKKRWTESEKWRLADPNSGSGDNSATLRLPVQSAARLQPATSGSLGLALATAIDGTLIDNRPQKGPTGLKGPLIIGGQAHGALLLGRSSSRMKGLFVLPGLIDVDYNGEICIMVQTHFPPMYIPKGSRISQLVPMQQLTVAMTPANKEKRWERIWIYRWTCIIDTFNGKSSCCKCSYQVWPTNFTPSCPFGPRLGLAYHLPIDLATTMSTTKNDGRSRRSGWSCYCTAKPRYSPSYYRWQNCFYLCHHNATARKG